METKLYTFNYGISDDWLMNNRSPEWEYFYVDIPILGFKKFVNVTKPIQFFRIGGI